MFGIDPTFNLGKFYVTLTTFTYNQVVNKTTDVSPTFFGPIFVHTEKNYESYHYFFSTLVKLESRITDLVAVGTDGETAIVQALKATLHGNTIYLRCFLHMKENIKHKLMDLFIPENVSQEIIKDLFGVQQGTDYIKGAVDLLNAMEFDTCLHGLKTKWDQLECSVYPDRHPLFYEWFIKNESDVMKHQ